MKAVCERCSVSGCHSLQCRDEHCPQQPTARELLGEFAVSIGAAILVIALFIRIEGVWPL
jgi:purine-cytosine permease-like protein